MELFREEGGEWCCVSSLVQPVHTSADIELL